MDNNLLKKKNSFNENKNKFTLFQKIEFINQLEEQACLLFLKKEKQLRKKKKKFSNSGIQDSSLRPIVSFLEELYEISKHLEKERQKTILTTNKKKHLLLGCNNIQYIQWGGFTKIFKPDDNTSDFLLGIRMGINTREKASIRSRAAFLIDKALGLNLVPETIVGVHQGKKGSIQNIVEGIHFYEKKFLKILDKKMMDLVCCYGIEKFKNNLVGDALGKEKKFSVYYGLLLDPLLEREGSHAPVCKNGIPVTKNKAKTFFLLEKICLGEKQLYKTNEIDFSNPTLQKSLIDAQLFDFIIGQLDRNSGNFIFVKKEKIKSTVFSLADHNVHEEIIVKLLDHDYTFPSQFKKLDLETKEALSKESVLTELPPVVDAVTVEKILNLDFPKLKKELLECGLTLEEVDACQSRWEIVKGHLQYLKLSPVFKNSFEEKIISVWNEKTYRLLTRERKDSSGEAIHNNYISKNSEKSQKSLAVFNLLKNYQELLNLNILGLS